MDSIRLVGTAGLIGLFSSAAPAQVEVHLLHPAGASESRVLAVGAGGLGGSARFDGVGKAVFWPDPTAAPVVLHPPGAVESAVLMVGETPIQGGYVDWPVR